jgi:hypothetical protein
LAVKKLLLTLILAFPLFAASIVSITPAVGTTGGGDKVTIVIDTPLFACQICSPPASFATVTFGGVPARTVYTFGELVAVTPEHAAGTVDVAVTSRNPQTGEVRDYGTKPFTFSGWFGPNFDRANYEKVLVPVAYPADRVVNGAFGSRWTSELWVNNRSEYPVELFNDVVCTIICPRIAAGAPFPRIGAKSTERISPIDIPGNMGYLFYLQKGGRDQVDFSLHFADISRSTENAGTEVGVVREREFRIGTFEILNVAIDTRSRATLRIYDTDASPFSTAPATVEIFAMDGTPVASTHVPLDVPVARSPATLADVIPPFARSGQLTDLRNAQYDDPPASWPSRVRIRITTYSNAWAFVSVTNNATQLITTYKPE